jgi:CBS domain-containing protein
MKVKDVMRTRNVASVQPGDDLALAAQVMRWAGVRHLPVLERKHVVGVLTERDLLRHRAETAGQGMRREGHDQGPDEGRDQRDQVRQYMSSPAEVASPEDTLGDAAERLVREGIGCLPVVEEGALVGLLTITDIVGLALAAPGPRAAGGETRVEVAMKRDPARLGPSSPLLEAVGIMVDREVRHIPVVDGEQHVVGIISDRDVRTALGDPLEALHGDFPEIDELKVAGVMTTRPSTVREDAPLGEAARHFIDERIGALPVVDADDHLVGILSYVDVIRALQERLSTAAA